MENDVLYFSSISRNESNQLIAYKIISDLERLCLWMFSRALKWAPKSHDNVWNEQYFSIYSVMFGFWNYTDMFTGSCNSRIDRAGILILHWILHSECFLVINWFYAPVLLDRMFRSQYDLGAGQSAARSWVSQLEHQRWLEIHHFILRVLIDSNFRDQLPTLLHQWRSVVRIGISHIFFLCIINRLESKLEGLTLPYESNLLNFRD